MGSDEAPLPSAESISFPMCLEASISRRAYQVPPTAPTDVPINRLAAVLLLAMTAGCAGVFDREPPAPRPLVRWDAPASLSGSERQALRAQSFALRCASPDIVRCVSFETTDQIPDLSWRRVGDRQGRGPMGLITAAGSSAVPELDCEVALGGCSLRFVIPSRSGSGASGSWFVNFSDDFSVRFGEKEEFYVQWRQRFSRAFLETQFRGGGWKQAIIGEGDRPGYLPDGKVVWSCTQLELVVQNTDMRGHPQMYHSCGGKDGRYEGLFDYDAVDYAPDEWMTFQVRVKIGSWYKNDRKYHGDSTIELWVAREGQASRRVVVAERYDIANTKPGAKYGKLWLLPYHSHKDSSQDHPVGHTWYDEVIISRSPIPDP
jgi:hypothetical protein